MAGGKEFLITLPEQSIALPTEEREKQLKTALEAPDWSSQLAVAFPDVITQKQIEKQIQILQDIAKAKKRQDRWEKAVATSRYGGLTVMVGGVFGENVLIATAGFVGFMGGMFIFGSKSLEQQNILEQKAKEWSFMSSHWWEEQK